MTERTVRELRRIPVEPKLQGLTLVVAAAIFVFDVLVEPHLAASIAYVGLILLCRWSNWPPFALWLAGLATLCNIAAYFVADAHGSALDMANRALALGVVWLTAALCRRQAETANQLERARAALARQRDDVVVTAAQARTALRSERKDRKRIQAELQESEHRYHGFFHQTFQLAAVLDPSGMVEEANDTMLNAAGLTQAEVAGRPIWALPVWPDDAREALRDAVAHAASGDFIRDEFRMSPVNGDGMAVDVSIKPIREESGKVDLLILEARDVTQHKQNQEMLMQAQKMEVLGQLASGIAHDFNNLLTVIGGNLELVGRRLKDNDAVSERLEKALKAVFQGRALTDQMLAFARKQELSPQAVDLNELIAETEELFRRGLDENTSVRAELEPGLWPCRADPAQLQTALLNLLINARDAMASGGRIGIRTFNWTQRAGRARRSPDLADGDYVILTVTDEGEGIRPEVMVKVTEPFFTTKAPGKGSGLGLSMVYGFIKASGGELEIQSTHGAGTEVSLYLPRSPEAPPPLAEPPESATPRHEARVLVVEDDVEARDVAVSMLRDLGYEVEEAPDADAALEHLKRAARPFDLMLTDIMMPGDKDGTSLGRLARSLCPDLKVLYASGHPQKVADVPEPKDGPQDFIAKPYQYAELARKAEALLSAGEEPGA